MANTPARPPARPPSVPPEAVFSAETDSWEIGERAADGRRRGLCTFYRADGALYLRGHFEAGVEHGPFSMFHPDGTVAREGTYARGELDGDLVAYASPSPTTVPLRGCCVPDNARTLRATYRQGSLVRETFFDAEAHELTPAGLRIPDRPASVPAEASFDDGSWRWVVRTAKGPLGRVDRYLTPEGAPSEELEYSDRVKIARRRFDAQGTLRAWNGFDEAGRLHGPSLKRVPDDQPSPHADPRIRAERGCFENGHPVDRWELLGEGDEVIRTLDFGRTWPPDAASWSPALSDDAADATALWAAVETLQADHRVREALCVAARAAVRTGAPDGAERLTAFVKASTLQLTPALTHERGAALVKGEIGQITFLGALDELLTGADPAAVYRMLAATLDHEPRLAHELIEAALLLAPDGPLFHLTRGLIRLDLGDPVGAVDDAERLEKEAPDAARLLRESAQVLFPEYGFWPAQQNLPQASAQTPDLGVAQSLQSVRHQIQVYATRQMQFRAALQKLHGPHRPAGWLPPDCSALLPDGPVALRHDTISILDEDEDGVEEQIDVTFDERIDGIPAHTAPPLLSAARANWAALAWLCWAAGLDQVALPDQLQHRPEFAVAVAASVERRFRARDLVTTSGLLARSRGAPGFVWEGFDIDTLPGRLASVLADECQEIRAMFLWSMWPQNVSPFQTDLRPD